MTDIDWHTRAKNVDIGIHNFINGKFVECQGNDRIAKYSPRDGSLLYEFNNSNGVEVEHAVTTARTAFEDGRWKGLPVHQRKYILQKLADIIEAHRETFALYECLDVGKPISNALSDDVSRAVFSLRSVAEKSDKLLAQTGNDGSVIAYQVRKPVGVVGGIIGWNYPLSLAAAKLGPALAMGNSLVLKPSEFTSLSASRLAEMAVEAGIPPGVFNVVHGTGATVGAALARHSDVNLLSFVGSSAAGKQMMVAAGQSNMKRLILECGGKSPYIVFDDCPDDLDFMAADIVATAFPNQGALCVAGTRLLIHECIKDRLLPKILEQASHIVPQDPLNPETSFGALVNETHMNKVLAYIESGKQEAARLLLGGKRVNVETGGYYIEPTIFDNVHPQQKIAHEEIFGPVLSVLTFKNEEEAITLANNSCFGLAAYVATENLGRAQRMGVGLNAGVVMITGSSAPSNGSVEIGIEAQKESGFGFEGGTAGLEAYTISTLINLFV